MARHQLSPSGYSNKSGQNPLPQNRTPDYYRTTSSAHHLSPSFSYSYPSSHQHYQQYTTATAPPPPPSRSRHHHMPNVTRKPVHSLPHPHTYLQSRSASLPNNIGDLQIPRSSNNHRKVSSTPRWGHNSGQNGQGASLSAVRLMPIQSRPAAPVLENPLDRLHSGDVLLGRTRATPSSMVSSCMQQVCSPLSPVQRGGLAQVMKLLQLDDQHTKAQQFVEAGILSPLRGCLKQEESPEVQLVALKIVSHLVSGPAELTEAVVKSGCAPYLIPLVSSHHASVSEEAVWALGNMAGDSTEVRELVLRTGVMPALLKVVASDSWARDRDAVTASFAQKLGSVSPLNESSSADLRQNSALGQGYTSPPSALPKPQSRTRPSLAPRVRSFSNPTFPVAPFSPRDVEVRQRGRGGSVSLLAPSIVVPRTAGAPRRDGIGGAGC